MTGYKNSVYVRVVVCDAFNAELEQLSVKCQHAYNSIS